MSENKSTKKCKSVVMKPTKIYVKFDDEERRSDTITEVQKKMLLKYYKQNPDIRPGRVCTEVTKQLVIEKKWHTIISHLHSVKFGAHKTMFQWKKCLGDQLRILKKKIAANRQSQTTAGGSPQDIIPLTPEEEELAATFPQISAIEDSNMKEFLKEFKDEERTSVVNDALADGETSNETDPFGELESVDSTGTEGVAFQKNELNHFEHVSVKTDYLDFEENSEGNVEAHRECSQLTVEGYPETKARTVDFGVSEAQNIQKSPTTPSEEFGKAEVPTSFLSNTTINVLKLNSKENSIDNIAHKQKSDVRCQETLPMDSNNPVCVSQKELETRKRVYDQKLFYSAKAVRLQAIQTRILRYTNNKLICPW